MAGGIASALTQSPFYGAAGDALGYLGSFQSVDDGRWSLLITLVSIPVHASPARRQRRYMSVPRGASVMPARSAILLQEWCQHACGGPAAGRLLESCATGGSSHAAWNGAVEWMSVHADHTDLAAS
jgi:hypothetical protein